MRILALDPSSTNVGWCVGSHQQDTPIESGVYSPKGKVAIRTRLIYLWARELFQTWTPDIVAVEEPAGNHGNRKTDRLLANITGLLMALSFESGREVSHFIRIYPAQVKATKCSKDNLNYAATMAGRAVGEDEADAIGVWLAASAKIRERSLSGS